jgi:diguanylate cyclase (GGDEF)-like protein
LGRVGFSQQDRDLEVYAARAVDIHHNHTAASLLPSPVHADVQRMRRLPRLTHLVGKPSLVLRFAIVSAVLVAALGAIAMNWLTGYIQSSNVASARDTGKYSVDLTVNQLHIVAGRPSTFSPAEYKAAGTLLQSIVATNKYLGATAWTPGSVVAYAAESGRVGKKEGTRPELKAAFAGQLTTAVVHRSVPGVPDATERTALKQAGSLIEIFAPLILDSKVVAVVQLYQPWTPVEKAISHQTRIVVWSLLGGLAVLWVGLFSLVLSASRRVREQSAANKYLASHDALTGLANRNLLREHVETVLEALPWSGRRMGLMLLDLDRFKEVNDTLGHHVGDALLKQVGPRLSVALREGDSIARLGGDEFVVVLADIADAAAALAIADRMKQALATPFIVDSFSLDVQASIGIAIGPDDGADFATLLKHADIAMYTAKTNRSYIAVYSAATDYRCPGQLERISQLRQAVSGTQELELHYQPKADLLTGQIQGVEALVRWRHPTDGLLSPAEFIPLAERTGLIGPLTVLVLREALGRLREWNKAGLSLSMAVNISPRSLLDAAFPELVGALIREYGIDPSHLELEITEDAVIADPERATTVLSALAELGVVLAVDDFGTGHASMSYLKNLPVHVLKIDQSFVRDMATEPIDGVIVRSCIDLGHNLNLTVVAEGVEDAATWDQLTRLGCQQAQGYYLARPMPAAALLVWLAAHRSQAGVSLQRSAH